MFRKSFELALISFSLMAAWAGAVSASDAPYGRAVYNAPLTRFQIDRQLALDVRAGQVKLDFIRGVATLTLESRLHCPPNVMCPMYMPAPAIFAAKIVSVQKTPAGTVTIAQRDDRPRDGGAVRITITDTSTSILPNARFMAPTVVELRTMSLRGTNSRSLMYGNPLRD